MLGKPQSSTEDATTGAETVILFVHWLSQWPSAEPHTCGTVSKHLLNEWNILYN